MSVSVRTDISGKSKKEKIAFLFFFSFSKHFFRLIFFCERNTVPEKKFVDRNFEIFLAIFHEEV